MSLFKKYYWVRQYDIKDGSVVQIYHDPIISKNKDTTFFVVEGTIENKGKKKLRSGSTGKAAIVVDQRNILSLILEKLDVLN
ncbi:MULTISPECIES: hypothetical protein [Bacillus]|uniref:hypothetical protein n=1 Tax=Bacillus TaxID=1386 RepID=UPI0020D23228|nr:hypothetical protein [Bacillus wiedmannii]MCU5705505.1 hypothetical protein [Bacillus wiedmannii]